MSKLVHPAQRHAPVAVLLVMYRKSHMLLSQGSRGGAATGTTALTGPVRIWLAAICHEMGNTCLEGGRCYGVESGGDRALESGVRDDPAILLCFAESVDG